MEGEKAVTECRLMKAYELCCRALKLDPDNEEAIALDRTCHYILE